MKLKDVEEYLSKLDCPIQKTFHYNIAFNNYNVMIQTVNDLKDHVDVVEILDNEDEYNQGIYRVLMSKSE